MIRLPHYLTALFIAASVSTAYPIDSYDLPDEILVILNEKALQLYPSDARAQDKFVRDNHSAYINLKSYITPKSAEIEFLKIKKMAEDKFPFDYTKQYSFLEKMMDGLALIDAFDFAFSDKEEFATMKAHVLAANPDNYMEAAKSFERQASSVMEISNIPRPESISEEEWSVFKIGLSSKYKNDYAKQKSVLMNFYERMAEFYVYLETKKSTEQFSAQGPTKWELQEKLKKSMGDAVLLVQNDQAIAFLTTINGKDVVVFPSEMYDARGISITNKLGERVTFGDVYASKDIPVSIAFVNSVPEGLNKVTIADDAFLRENINKDVLLYAFEMRNDNLYKNRLTAISSKNLNLSTRLPRTIVPGSIILNDEGSKVIGMVLNQTSLADIGSVSNKDDAKHLVKQLKKEIQNKILVRLDKLENWEKIDPQVFIQQSELLNSLIKNNEQYLTLFTTNKLSAFEDKDVLRSIYEKYSLESKNKYEKTAQERLVREMLSEIASNMRREVLKINASQMYVSLQENFEFNLKIRQTMLDAIESALKNKTYMTNFYFDDMKPKGK